MTAPSCAGSKFEKTLADRAVPHMRQSQISPEIDNQLRRPRWHPGRTCTNIETGGLRRGRSMSPNTCLSSGPHMLYNCSCESRSIWGGVLFMRSLPMSILFTCLLVAPAMAGSECRKCLREKLDGSQSKAAATAALGAIAGSKEGALGAMCGAIIGAAGSEISTLIEIGGCKSICQKEATLTVDPNRNCEKLLTKAK
jgi:hypothetical protein